MNEFKGSKGKWKVDTTGYKTANGGICVMDLNEYMDYKECIAVVGDGNPHQPITANALLISKAPEMLEMLKRIVYNLENEECPFDEDEIKALIKSATEL